MKIRLVAIDLDGTLLNSAKEITDVTAEILRRAHRQAGAYLVLATARPPRSVLPFYSLLELDTPMINYNGALILHPRTGRVLLHRALPGPTAWEAARTLRRVWPEVLISAEIMDRWFTDRYRPGTASAEQTETAKLHPPDVVAPLEEWIHQDVTKLLAYGHPDRLAEGARALRHDMEGIVAVVQTDANLLQISHPLVSKAVALKIVADAMGIDRSEVMAIGDNANDVGMLRWARVGVAVGNAVPEALDAADYVTDTNDADGAANAVLRLLLDPPGP